MIEQPTTYSGGEERSKLMTNVVHVGLADLKRQSGDNCWGGFGIKRQDKDPLTAWHHLQTYVSSIQ